MSGHSKWATIKRKKGAIDAKRGKLFTQIIRELVMAARSGGGDLDGNPRLRLAFDKARSNNMPKDTIERAIKRGSGELGGENYEEVRYEGYGPGGVAVIVETLTDNRNRTVGEVRHAFGKYGGNLGATGCVAFMFDRKGILSFEVGAEREKLVEAAIELDALDVVEDEGSVEVLTIPEQFEAIKAALEKRGFTPGNAEVAMIPQNTVKLAGKEAQSMLKLMEVLDDHDDVKEVFANFDIAEDELLAGVGAD